VGSKRSEGSRADRLGTPKTIKVAYLVVLVTLHPDIYVHPKC